MFESAKQSMISAGVIDHLGPPSESAIETLSPINTLPNELLYRIATFIPANSKTARGYDIPDRFHLALVSKRFNGACTTLLYEYVFLDSYEQLFKFHLSTGVARESWRTVSLVVAYTALFKHRNHPQDTTWPRLLLPLTKMRSLREFVLDRSGEKCRHFNLEHPVLSYLVSHASSPDFFPNLSVLEIPYYPGLLSLCRSRPITSVSLGSSPSPTSSESFDEFVSELGKTNSCLDELSLTVPFEGPQTEQVNSRIRRIVALCPNPRAVNLKLPYGFLPGWHLNTLEATFTAWVETTLAPWTQLTHLSIRTSVSVNASMRMQESIIGTLVKMMPNLKHLILPVAQGEWTRAPNCDGIPEWTPRPDLGTEPINWWFDVLGIQQDAYTQPSNDPSISGVIVDPLKVDEEVARARILMLKWWCDAVIPSRANIRLSLMERDSRGHSQEKQQANAQS